MGWLCSLWSKYSTAICPSIERKSCDAWVKARVTVGHENVDSCVTWRAFKRGTNIRNVFRPQGAKPSSILFLSRSCTFSLHWKAYRKQEFIINHHYFYGNATFGDCEIDDESMTQLANKIETQIVARYDLSFDSGVSDFFADLPLLPPTAGDMNVQVQTTTRRYATSTSEEDLNSLVQATKSKNTEQSTTWAVKMFIDWPVIHFHLNWPMELIMSPFQAYPIASLAKKVA